MIDGSEKHNQTISIAVQDWCNGAASGSNPVEQKFKINLSVPLKINISPKISAKGTNCPPVIKS